MSILNNPLYFDESNTALYLPLDGNANARIGTSGTATNITWVASSRGYTSECGSFNGSSSYIQNGTFSSDVYCVSGWFYFASDITSATSGQILCNFSNVQTTPKMLGIGGITGILANEVLTVYEGNSSGNNRRTAITTNISAGWRHICINWNSTAGRYDFYIDNVLQSGYISSTDGHANLFTSTDCADFGVWDYTTSKLFHFNGNMGEVRISSNALTEQEIQNLYLQGLRKYGPSNNLPTFTTSLSPTAFYVLNGDALDYAGSNDLTPSNITYSPVWGGEYADFNGTTSYAEDNTNNDLKNSSGTISFWFNPDAIPTGSANTDIVMRYQTNNTGLGAWYGWQFQLFDSQIRFSFKTSNGADLSTLIGVPVTVGEMCLITITYDSSNIYMYKNGIQTSTTTGVTPQWDTNMQLILGCFESVGIKTRHFNGKIGLVYISDSVDDVTKLYNEGSKYIYNNRYSLPNLRDGLVLDISKAQVSGTYYDQSGTGNNSSSVTSVTDVAKGLNNVMSFNGSSSKIELYNLLPLNQLPPVNERFNITKNFSIFQIISPTSTTSYVTLLQIHLRSYNWSNNDARGIWFHIKDGALCVWIKNVTDTGGQLTSSVPIETNKIQFVGIVRDGTNVNFIKDGIILDTLTVTDNNIQWQGTASTASSSCNIGMLFYEKGKVLESLGGTMSQSLVYNRALTAEEVQQLYFSNFLTN